MSRHEEISQAAGPKEIKIGAPMNNRDHLEAMGIDQEVRNILRELRPTVASHIDEIITAAYSQILRHEEVKAAYRSANLDDAKRSQIDHWVDGVFSGTFSDEYFHKSAEMGKGRQKSGLSIHWYMVFWTVVCNKIIEKSIPIYRKKPEKLLKVISAINKVVIFDLEIFTAVYIDAANGTAAEQLNESADEFERKVSALVKTVATSAADLKATAQVMASEAEQTAGQSKAALAAVEHVGKNTQMVAAATEELSSSILEIGRQVAQSTEIAHGAVSEADRTNALVLGLAEAANRIGDVIKLINNIASQTNLLALNATIEAARAGEAGKGFAVVAGEVKNLANQTAKATGDISAQIAAVQSSTKDTVAAIQGIGTTIEKISEITSAIAAAVEEQRAATQEISRNVHEVASGADGADKYMASVTDLANQTGEATQGVLAKAGDLTRQSDQLAVQVDQFVTKIRR